MQKTAIVFGATGLTGGYLTRELTQLDDYDKIKVFNRKLQVYNHPKIEEHLIDYSKLNEYAHELKGNDVFCCLGTTLKKAGSKEKFFAIDHDLPLELAKICSNNNCDSFIAISSIGANMNSSNYYLNTKGLMEADILEFTFNYIAFVRPSVLLGARNESRIMESIGKIIINSAGFLFIGKLKKYKAIHAKTLAKAMVKIINQSQSFVKIEKNIFESNELVRIAKNQAL